MSSKYSKKYLIPPGFTEILHDFGKEVVRHQPKDILDFAIQYFYSLEKKSPLNYIEGNSQNIQKSNYNKELLENRTDDTNFNSEIKQNEMNLTNQKSFDEDNKENTNDINEIIVSQPTGLDEAKIKRISKDFMDSIFEENMRKIKKNKKLEGFQRIEEIKEDEKFEEKSMKSKTTFDNISVNSDVKNDIKNFVGDIIQESKKNVSNKKFI